MTRLATTKQLGWESVPNYDGTIKGYVIANVTEAMPEQ
jgi:hypothetical protein